MKRMERAVLDGDGGHRENTSNKRSRRNDDQSDLDKGDFTDIPCLINSLNSDCLAAIFRHLKPFEQRIVVRQVCKKWRNVSQYCWNDLHQLSIFKRGAFGDNEEITVKRNYVHVVTADPPVVKGIFSLCGSFLRSLRVRSNDKSVIQMAVKHCRALEELDIMVETQEEIDALTYLLLASKHLKVLHIQLRQGKFLRCLQAINVETIRNLDLIIPSNEPTVIAILRELIEKILNLESFQCNQINADLLNALGRKTSLKSLKFRCAQNMDLPQHQILNLNNLEFLSMGSLDCSWLTNEFVQLLVERCPQLRKIELIESRHITDEVFKSLSQLQNLDYLAITDSPHIRGELVWLCKQLKELAFARCPIHNYIIERLLEDSMILEGLLLFGTRITKHLLAGINSALSLRRNGKKLNVSIEKRNYCKIINQSPLLQIDLGYR